MDEVVWWAVRRYSSLDIEEERNGLLWQFT